MKAKNISKPSLVWVVVAVVLLVGAIGGYFFYQEHQKQIRREQAEKFIEKQREFREKTDQPHLFAPFSTGGKS